MVNRRQRASVQTHRIVGQGLDLNAQTGSSSSNSQENTPVSTQTNPSQPSAASSAIPTALPIASHSSFTFITNSLPLSVHDPSVTVVVQFPPPTPIASVLPPPSSTPSTSLVNSTTPSVVSNTPEVLPIASSSTDVTSLLTSMSGAVPVTSTAISSAAVSPASVPKPSSSSFFQNKAESGAVLGVVSLVALTGIGFIAYRFYRSVKERQADRETEYAARDAANVKVRLDDDDDDDVYGTPAKGRGNTLPFFNRPTVIPLNFSTNGNMGAGDFDGNRPSEGTDTYFKNGAGTYNVSLPLHHQPHVPPPYFPPPLDPTVHSSQTLDLRPSMESTDSLILTRSESSVPREVVSQTVPSQAPAPQQSPLPALSLPEAFGEGEPGRRRDPALTMSMGDDEDYSSAIRRVLKIANE